MKEKKERPHYFRIPLGYLRGTFSLFTGLCVFLVVLYPQYSRADIYMFVDGNGVIHFTDLPKHKGYRMIIKSPPKTALKTETNSKFRKHIEKREEIDRIINVTSEKNNIDPALIKAVIMAESSFDIHAVSKKGARGLMQLMPETARRYNVFNSFDPAQNIKGGTTYLKELLKRYKGNIDYTLAAYNAGEKAVYDYDGIPPYKETKDYIKRVKRYYKNFKIKSGY